MDYTKRTHRNCTHEEFERLLTAAYRNLQIAESEEEDIYLSDLENIPEDRNSPEVQKQYERVHNRMNALRVKIAHYSAEIKKF